jgi:hypothetical protein
MANNGSKQKVVPVSEVEGYISNGWEFVAALPNDRAVVKVPFGAVGVRNEDLAVRGEGDIDQPQPHLTLRRVLFGRQFILLRYQDRVEWGIVRNSPLRESL